jgi:nickel-dependent lactate racemase
VIRPREVAPAATPADRVREALQAPLELDPGRVRGARTAAIAINDKTRPVPHRVLLPPLLAWLEEQGVPAAGITLIIATGTHEPMPESEYPSIVPQEVLDRFQVICHDARDTGELVEVDATSRGNRVTINRRFVEADLRVVVGNIEPHQFMGFSGGAKSACIGLAGYETITRNHAQMNDPDAVIGTLTGNPVREEVEEMADLVRVDLALNAVLNDHKELVRVFAGAPGAVMRAGVPAVLELYEVSVPARFDLVITAPGGHPKDINLYQAQKALAHAARVAAPGAPMVLVAACPDGTGSAHYEEWVRGMESQKEVLARFDREPFQLGPHKAFQIARDSVDRRVQLVSEMSPELVRELLLEPASTVDEALSRLVAELPPEPRVAVLPVANATIPSVAAAAEGRGTP